MANWYFFLLGTRSDFGNATMLDAVAHELARWMHRNVLYSFAALGFAVVLVYVNYQERAPHAVLMGIVIIGSLLNLYHLQLWRSFPAEPGPRVRTWLVSQALVILGGTLWAATAYALIGGMGKADEPANSLVFIAVFTGANTALATAMPMVALLSLLISTMAVVAGLTQAAEGSAAMLVAWLVLVGAYAVVLPTFSTALRETIRGRLHQATVLREIASRKQQTEILNEELAHARDEANRANRTKTQFVAAASHDLHQPLTAISLLLDALEADGDTARTRRLQHQLADNLTALESLVAGLLDMPPAHDPMSTSTESFALQPIFDGLQARFEEVCRRQNVCLLFKPTDAMLQGSPRVLDSVLSNLVSNAVRATAPGTVWVSYRPQRRVIEVRDSGCGIDAAALPHIFNEFYRGNAAPFRPEEGYGLGLSIVRRLLERTGQACSVRSRPGIGTVIAVTVTPDGAATPATPPLESGPGSPMTLTNRAPLDVSILLVEDDVEITKAFSELMLQWRVDCRCANDVASAHAHLDQGFRPDLLVSDYWLGGGEDGLMLLGALRQHLRRQGVQHAPALLLTGDISADLEARSKSAGVELLHKPVSPLQLRALLESLARARSASAL